MADLNQLKLVLVKKKRTGKWIQNNWGKLVVLLANGALMRRN
jgi:hypothetical protein